MFNELLVGTMDVPAAPSADKCFGFTREMVESIHGFVCASDLERKCIYAVAAQTMAKDLDVFREAFCCMDRDHDGRLLRRDLRALDVVSRQFNVALPVDAVFRAVDLHCLGSVDFVQFAAACLHSQLTPLDSWLTKQSFEALDDDRDGFITSGDVVKIFGDLPVGLPSAGPFGYNVWHTIMVECSSPKANKSPMVGALSMKMGEMPGFLDLLFFGCTDQRCDRGTEFLQSRKISALPFCGNTDDLNSSADTGLEQAVSGSPFGRSPAFFAAIPPRTPSRCGEEYGVFRGLSSPTYVPMSAR